MRKLYSVLAGLIISISAMAQAGTLIWEKSYGGSGADSARSIANTTDGGYYVAGVTYSTDGDVTGTHSNTGTYSDVWVIKINSSGGLVWEKTFGGSNQDQANSIYATSDGGAVIAGWTNSSDGDIDSLHGSAGGAADFWILKIDNTGALQWQETLGGTGNDYAQSVQQTSDGGYIVAGSTYSHDGDVAGNHDLTGATADFWVVKLGSTGAVQWQKNYGGSLNDFASGVTQTAAGGYAVTGTSFSSDGDISRNNLIGSTTSSVYWLLSLDNTGAITWESNFGGTANSAATALVQTSDAGFVMAGSTNATNGNVPQPTYGEADNWIVKTSNSGGLDYGNCWGGSLNDFANGIRQTRDGSLIITGSTTSSNGLVSGQHGSGGTTQDFWTYELKASGYATYWSNCFGGSGNDAGFDVTESTDSNFVEVGTSNSTDGNVSGNNGSYDFWVIKVQSNEGSASSTSGIANVASGDNALNIYPNPANDYATISVSNNLVGNWIELSDAVGRTILRQQIISSKFDIQTNGLARGMYFIKVIENNTSTTVKKLVIQ